MLVVDGVVLQRLDQRQQVVRLRDEDPIVVQHRQDRFDDLVDVLDVREHVGRRDDLRAPVLLDDLRGGLRPEERVDGRDAALHRDLEGVGRLDAAHAVAALVEIRQQRAVVRPDVDRQRLFPDRIEPHHFVVQLGEVLAQDARRAARVGVVRREQDCGIDDEAELHELAVRAVQQLRRIGRLLVRTASDRIHRVDWRQIANKQDRTQLLRAANLAALHKDAAARLGGFPIRVKNIDHRSP